MRLNIDTPPIQGNQLPAELNRWFSNIVDQVNFMFGNIVANRTSNLSGSGAGPYGVDVPGMTADSIITASIQTSTNAVNIVSVTARALPTTGFDILFSADPGLVCTVNYIAFISNWEAQGAV